MTKLKSISYYLILLILIFGCSGSQKTVKEKTVISENPSDCHMKATLEWHPESSHSDCMWVLVLEEGERVLPMNGQDINKQFKDGDHVKLGLEWLKSDANLCHNTTGHIRIKCMIPFRINSTSVNDKCINTMDVYGTPWMNHVMIKMLPTKVIKYELDDMFAYHFIKKDHEIIYACSGEIMCESQKNNKLCDDWLEELKNPQVILVVNN